MRLDQGAGGDGVSGITGGIELRRGDAGERDATEARLGDGGAARKRAGDGEHPDSVGDRPGLRRGEADRGSEDDRGGSAGLEADALRRGGRREIQSTTGRGEGDRSRGDARGGAGTEGERADAEDAVEIAGDRRGGGGVALEAHGAGLAGQDG